MLENVKIAAGIMILVLYFGIVPTVIGKFAVSILYKDTRINKAETYLWGNIILWVIFQILSVFMGIAGISFMSLTVVFTGIILICMLVSIKRYGRGLGISLYRIKELQFGEWLVVFLILGQVCMSVFKATYIGADDAAYIATSLDAVERNSISVVNPYTGEADGVSIKILLTSWNYYISFLSKISGIHVAAIAHTLLPVLLIPMAYMVYWLIARYLLNNDRKKTTICLLLLNFLILFGAYSWYTVSLRLDICVWHGKAVMAAILLPFLFYYLLRTDEYGKIELLCLLLIMTATCAMSLMGVGLSVIMVLATFVAKYKKNSIKKMAPLLLAVVLISLVAVFYVFSKNISYKLSYNGIKEFFSKSVNMALSAYSIYWNGTWLQGIYYISLGYLILQRKKDKKNNFLFKYIICQYILIFNPIFYYIAYIFLRDANVYVRLYYTLFPEIYMAYIITLVIGKLKERRKQILCVAISSGIIAGLGTPYLKIAVFSETENIYKIPQEVVELCDMVNADAIEEPRVIADESVVVFVRQYSSRIQLLFGRWGYDYNGSNLYGLIRTNEVSMEEIVKLMKKEECQYLIWKYNQKDIEELEILGGNIVGNTQNYVVVKIMEGEK